MSQAFITLLGRARAHLELVVVVFFASIALAALVVHYANDEAAPGEPLPRAGEGRLIVFWIDSLTVEDVEESAHLPRLEARLSGALHGRVRECLDAVSVPCFMAMTTGADHFSLLSLASNFAGARSLGESNVLVQARRRGLRVGYAGDPLVAASLGELDWIVTLEKPDDRATVAAALRGLDDARLDVLVVHVREPDAVSHRQGPAAPEYGAALARADALIDEAWSTLAPEDHVAVLGDHGHDARGRHLAGLDVPTYAVYAGPRFDRPLVRAMAITDHARIWAHLLGVAAPAVDWVDDYFGGLPVEATVALPPARVDASPLPAILAGAGMMLVFALGARLAARWLPPPLRSAGIVVALGGAGAMFALGYFFADFRERIYAPGHVVGTVGALMLGAPLAAVGVGLAARSPWARRHLPAWGLWMLGGILFALPTVYRIGGFVAGTSALLLFSLVASVRAFRRGRVRAGLAGLGFFVVFASFWVSLVVNFKLQYFVVYARSLREHLVSLTLTLGGAAAALLGAGRRGGLGNALALGVALAAVAGLAPLSPSAFAFPAVATPLLVVGALHRPALTPAALVVAPTGLAYFVEYDLVRLAPIVATLLCFVLFRHATEHA